MRKRAAEDGCTSVSCALLGDGMVGKSRLLLSYTGSVYTSKYSATVSDEYTIQLSAGEEQTMLHVHDTAGQSDFEDFRAHIYNANDVLVLCFSVSDIESFYSICHFWMPEMRRHMKRKVPIVLVGTQTDLRKGAHRTQVNTEEGRQLANLIGADVYVECSAKNKRGLNDVFNSIIECAVRRRKRKNSFIRRFLQR